MTKWIYRLFGVVILLAAFNIVRLFGGNEIIDIAFLVVITPIALNYIFGNKKYNVIKEDEES